MAGGPRNRPAPNEALIRAARGAAGCDVPENSPLKALIEEGLRLALRERTRKRAAPFSVRPFQGDGLSPEFDGAG